MEQAEFPLTGAIKSPKSTEFPVDRIVMCSIVLTLNTDGLSYPPPKTPRVLEEQAVPADFIAVKFPKLDAFPNVAIVIKSIEFTTVGVSPPANIPRVELEQEDEDARFTVKSPKSIAFPVDAIVMYSITFDGPGAPPPKIPRVLEEHPRTYPRAEVRFPKLTAFPVDAIVI